MIWGLGTGRCGTHSLAREIGGAHEPERPTMVHTARVANGFFSHEPEVRATLKSFIEERQPIVNLHLVPVLPLILELDPDPSFIWVWREYVDVMQSQLQPGHSYWQENARDWTEFMYPFNEWRHMPTYFQEQKGLWYWTAVNTEILRYMMLVPRETWHIIHTNDLEIRDAVGNPVPSPTACRLEPEARPLEILMEDLNDTNTDPDLASFVSRVQGASYGDQETE
jgi:hypothetical protein